MARRPVRRRRTREPRLDRRDVLSIADRPRRASGSRVGSRNSGEREQICRRSSRDRSRRGRRTGGLGGDVGAESHLDAAGGLAADGHVEEAHGVGHGVLSGCSKERAQVGVAVTCSGKTLYFPLFFGTENFVWAISQKIRRSQRAAVFLVGRRACASSSSAKGRENLQQDLDPTVGAPSTHAKARGHPIASPERP